MTLNISDIFERVVDAVPDDIALIGGRSRLSYRELDERANRLAHHLVAKGVTPGSFIGVLARNRVEWLETMIGCFKCRAVPVNLNYRYVSHELRYVAEDAGLVGLIYERSFTELVREGCSGIPGLKCVLVMEDGTPREGSAESLPGTERYEDVLARASSTRHGLPVRSADDLYVLYTGGTTGMPKGVVWRQGDLYMGPLGGSVQRGGPAISSEVVARRISGAGARQTVLVIPPLMPEAVKANETGFVQTFCISASWGSLIHATVGSAGGVGRPANREGLAA